MNARKGRPPNVEMLRAAIDRGETGDKVPYPDPAAAPLGTDDEAAGTPPPPEALDIAFASEMRPSVRHRRGEGDWVPVALAAFAFITVIAIALAAVMA